MVCTEKEKRHSFSPSQCEPREMAVACIKKTEAFKRGLRGHHQGDFPWLHGDDFISPTFCSLFLSPRHPFDLCFRAHYLFSLCWQQFRLYHISRKSVGVGALFFFPRSIVFNTFKYSSASAAERNKSCPVRIFCLL